MGVAGERGAWGGPEGGARSVFCARNAPQLHRRENS